nr:DUF5801 repeats-in-toxin domain-containing protein [uncultured Brevundimonas sp.]
MAFNDDSNLALIGDGSTSQLDSFLQLNLLPGDYILAVGDFFLSEQEARDGFQNGRDTGGYQVTFTGPVTVTDVPANASIETITPDPLPAPGRGAGARPRGAGQGVRRRSIRSTPAPMAVDHDTIAVLNALGGAFNGESSGLFTTDGSEIFLFGDPGNPTLVLGREDGPAGAIALVLYLDPESGELWLATTKAIAHPDSSDPDETLILNSTFFIGVTDADGDRRPGAQRPGGGNPRRRSDSYWAGGRRRGRGLRG